MITYANAANTGTEYDCNIFERSKIYEDFKNKKYEGAGIAVDAGFRDEMFSLKKIPEASRVSQGQKIFAKKQLSCRARVEQTNGILKGKFTILDRVQCQPKRAEDVIMACCVLHNAVRKWTFPDDPQEPRKYKVVTDAEVEAYKHIRNKILHGETGTSVQNKIIKYFGKYYLDIIVPNLNHFLDRYP